jgi:hypothetical protein
MGGLMSRLVRWWSSSASYITRGLIGPPPTSNTTSSPTSVLLFTQNIARHPIAWDPAQQRPTQEVIHAVHSALHFALDPCVDHPGEPLSFGVQDGVLVIPNVSFFYTSALYSGVSCTREQSKDLKQREAPKSGWEVNAK